MPFVCFWISPCKSIPLGPIISSLRHYISLTLILLLFAFGLHGQTAEEREHATFEVDQLMEQAQRSDGDSEKSELATRSLSLARELQYKGGIIRAAVLLGEISARAGKGEVALQYFLEAESKLQGIGNTVTLLAVYGALGDLFLKNKLNSHARRYYQKYLALQPQNEAIIEKVGDTFLNEFRIDSAEVYYKQLIVRYRETGDNPRLVHLFQKIANACDQTLDTQKSLAYYRQIEPLIEHFGTSQEKALLYNNLGRQYTLVSDHPNALTYFRKSELQCIYIPCQYPEVLFANLGISLHNTGKSKEGLEYLFKARNLLASRKDNTSLANLEHLIANVYFHSNDVYNAISHNEIAIRLGKETKQRPVLENAYRTAAELYHELYDFEKAFDYYREYLNMADTIRQENQKRLQNLSQQRALLAAAEDQISYLITRQNFKDLELAQAQFERERLELLTKNLELQKRQQDDQLVILQKQKNLDEAELRRRSLEALRTQQELRLAAQNLDAEKQSRLIAELRRQEDIDKAQRAADSTRRVQEQKDFLLKQQVATLELSRQVALNRFAYGLGSLLLLLLALLTVGWLLARRAGRRLQVQNSQIQIQNKQIEEERNKSDHLLLNILPDEIAQELRAQGYANPKHYASATVLFTDFVNFTSLSAQLSPNDLIAELDECFLAFDEIADKHHLEKIKTIGDAYMCAGGLPLPNDTHPEDAVRAALEMVAWLENRNQHNPKAVFREMRVGIHTGQVIAGVIGKNKFAYDIWGDAVNLAARLEEEGASNQVNISGATFDAIKNTFDCTPRGKKEVRNKGLVDMYFIKKEKNP